MTSQRQYLTAQLEKRGWSMYDEMFYPDFLLECHEHGNVVEQDGECPDGCENPIRMLGLI